MFRSGWRAWCGFWVFGVALAVGCGGGDPQQRILEERARWKVELLDWANQSDGTIVLTVRVSGPPSSSLDRLTFRIVAFDAQEHEVGGQWRTVELSQVPQGAGKDLVFRFDPAGAAVEGLSVSLVERPTAEQLRQIPELAPAGSSAD